MDTIDTGLQVQETWDLHHERRCKYPLPQKKARKKCGLSLDPLQNALHPQQQNGQDKTQGGKTE